MTHTSPMTDLRARIPNIAALVRTLDCDYSYLHAVLKGATRPGPEMAIKIEHATDRAIRRSDLRPDLWPPHLGKVG